MNRPYPYRWHRAGTSNPSPARCANLQCKYIGEHAHDHQIDEGGRTVFTMGLLGLVAHDLHTDPRFEFIIQRDQAAVREPETRRIARAY